MSRERLPNRRNAERINLNVNGLNFCAGIGFYADGRVGEIFLNAAKVGTHADIQARDLAITCSFALQHGTTLAALARALTRDAQGLPEGPLGVLLDRLLREGKT